MDYHERDLINCIEFLVRRIVREELKEPSEINIEDYRDSINDMIYDYIDSRMSISIEH